MLQPIRSNLTSHSRTVEKRSGNNIKDRSEITGGGGEGHYLCREGHNFFEQSFGRVTIFLPKLRGGGIIFLKQSQLILTDQSVLVTIFQLTVPSA